MKNKMTLESWLLLSYVVIFIGSVIAAGGTFASVWLQRKIDAEKEQKEAYAGVLEHKEELLLSTTKNVYPVLQIGETFLQWAGPQGQPIFKLDGADITIVRRDNKVLVSTTLRDEKGVVIAELIENEWKVNRNNSFDRNYNDNSLEVKNHKGQIVLQVVAYSNRVKFQGLFIGPNGQGSGIINSPNTGGAGFVFFKGEIPKEYEIPPMFRYPSELHFGELQKEPRNPQNRKRKKR